MGVFYEVKNRIMKRGLGLSPVRHLHNQIEIVYLLDGNAVAIAGEQAVTLEKGDIFIAFPNQIHYYHDTIPSPHIILIFEADIYPELQTFCRTWMPKSPLLHAGSNKQIDFWFHKLATFGENGPPDLFQEAEIRGYLLLLLGWILQSLEFYQDRQANTDALKAIVEYCNENYRHSIQLDDLEKALNINKYYISHLFRQKVGIGFSDFINYLRIYDACAMLIDSDIPITEIGFAVGFGSTRSFNRCFVSVIGESPRNYRSHYWRGKKDLAVT